MEAREQERIGIHGQDASYSIFINSNSFSPNFDIPAQYKASCLFTRTVDTDYVFEQKLFLQKSFYKQEIYRKKSRKLLLEETYRFREEK